MNFSIKLSAYRVWKTIVNVFNFNLNRQFNSLELVLYNTQL